MKKHAGYIVSVVALGCLLSACTPAEEITKEDFTPFSEARVDKQVAIVEDSVEMKVEGDFSFVHGKVKNDSDRMFEYAEVNIAIYNKDGERIDTAVDSISRLDAGETWRFKASTYEEGEEGITFKIQDVLVY